MPIINPAHMPEAVAVAYEGKTVTKCVLAKNKQGQESYTVSTLTGDKRTWRWESGKWRAVG